MLLLSFTSAACGLLLLSSAQSTGEFWDAAQWANNIFVNRTPILGALLLIAAVIFVALSSKPNDQVAEAVNWKNADAARFLPRFSLWATSLSISALASLAVASSGESRPHGYFTFSLWVGALVLTFITVLHEARFALPPRAAVSHWWNAHRREIALAAALLGVAGLLRSVSLETYPYSFINDEGEMGLAGRCILNGACTDFFDTAWAAQPRMAFVPTALSLAAFGNTATAARIPSVIFGVAAVAFTWLFARDVFSRTAGLISAAILATLPVHVHFSRLAVDNVVDATYSTAILWLLHRAVKRNSTIAGALAGLASMLALHTYTGSRLSILLGVVMLALFIASDRRLLRTRANVLATYLFVCVVGAMPIMTHYAIHPENFGARLAQENIFTSGILTNDAAIYGGYVSAIVRAALLSALPFFITPAAGGFFHAPFPHLPALGAIALLIGHGELLRRRRDPHTAAVLVWFWAAILLVSTLTSGPPTHERMLNTMPALAILVAVGINSAVAPFRSAALRAVLAAALVITISGRQVYAYFIEYDRSHAWEDPTNELTYETRHDIHSLRANGRVYLIGDPSVYRVFANFDFFSPNIEKADFNSINEASLASLPRDKDALFIAIPARLADLERIAARFPGGEIRRTNRVRQPELPLYFTYVVTTELFEAKPKP